MTNEWPSGSLARVPAGNRLDGWRRWLVAGRHQAAFPGLPSGFWGPIIARKGLPYKNGHPGPRTRLGGRGKACLAPPGRAEERAVEGTAATFRGHELVGVGEFAWQGTYDCSTRSSGGEGRPI